MKLLSLAVVALSSVTLLSTVAQADELPPTLTKSLDGWKPSTLAHCWELEDGVLTVTSDESRKGSTLWTDKEYGDFIIELEFKSVSGTVDSGVFLRQENDQIQIGISGSLKRDMTASPYIGGKGYPVEATGVADVLKADGWNAMKVVAVGNDYDVWLNGKHVCHYESDTAVERGPVGLQLHPGNEMVVQFRSVRLAELQ
ncbi:3-keto-disaccharide hydrolase [Botrimarina mediterranea]|uniref:3-keto-disaccharide hydrolase n=1 Tax=Botrimarina mediterranea TaxID=2528022 RepID=UPI00118B3474|nr:hypothetical protein K2D_02140 [Planctomycetes bacterium K2D]